MSTLSIAADAKRAHALVISPKEDTTDAQVLRLVEQAHAASASVEVVIHPTSSSGDTPAVDRRWSSLLEQAMVMHPDSRLVTRISPPAGLR
jgi:hypothetical protein